MNKREQAERLLYALGDADDAFIAEASEAARSADAPARGKLLPFKRKLRAAAALAACLAVALLAARIVHPNREAQPNSGDLTLTGSPFQEVATLDEAEALAGFDMEIPDAEPYGELSVSVLDGDMICAQYLAEGELRFEIRKAPGAEDVSGDYSEYSSAITETVGDREVTLKGDGTLWSLAIWTADGYSYAVGAQDRPLSLEAMTALIEATK